MKDKPLDVLRVQVLDAKSRQPIFDRPMFLAISGKRKSQVDNAQAQEQYRERYDVEPFYRFAKNKLLMDIQGCGFTADEFKRQLHKCFVDADSVVAKEVAFAADRNAHLLEALSDRERAQFSRLLDKLTASTARAYEATIKEQAARPRPETRP